MKTQPEEFYRRERRRADEMWSAQTLATSYVGNFKSGAKSQAEQTRDAPLAVLHSKTLSRGVPALAAAGLILAFCFSAPAQIQQAWVAKYNNGITNGNHQALKMSLDTAGNIYVLGVSANANTNTGYVTIKYAPNGRQVWAARYDSITYPFAAPTGFAIDSKGNVAVIGNAVTVRYDTNGNQLWAEPYNAQAIAVDGGQNVYITGVGSNFTTMKLSNLGSNIWTVTDPPTYSGSANIGQAIAIDTASNVFVCGSEIYFNSAETLATATLVKYDLNGNLLWKIDTRDYLGGGTVNIEGFALDRADSAYLVTDCFGYNFRYATFKYDSDGGFGWHSDNPTGDAFSVAHGLALDTVGNVIVTGGNAYYYPNYCYGTYKLDTNGNYLWTNLYPTIVSASSVAAAIAVDQGNNVYATGYGTITNTGSDIATLKYDSNGSQLWLQRYDGPGHGNDAGNAIAVDNSGNVYVAGYETETNGSTSMILIKYSPVTVQKQSNGNVILHAYGAPGATFDLQASTNLQTWQDLGDVIADTNGLVQFDDTNAPSFTSRFYYTVPQ